MDKIDKVKRIGITFIESNTEFEKALNKACYQGDDSEVKEKHVMHMLECFSGKQEDIIKPMDALYIYL